MQRKAWFDLIEGGFGGSRPARAISAFLVVLIVLNALAVVLESDPAHFAAYRYAFRVFEAFSVAAFTAEYLLRAWVAPEHERFAGMTAWAARRRYLVSPLALVDLAAILPAYLGHIFGLDLRYLRLLRLLRLLKLTHYFRGLTVFITVVQAEIRTLMSGIFTILVLVVIAAAFMYAFEHAAQPEAFATMGDSLWWAVVTMTTVGYGDITPVTAPGRVLATVIMLLGVGIVALPAGLLAARFAEELQARRDQLAAQLELALSDGRLNRTELQELEQLSAELGVSRETLHRMLQTQSLRHLVVPTCPHCGKRID